jgi:AraC-like DNA-binding protein
MDSDKIRKSSESPPPVSSGLIGDGTLRVAPLLGLRRILLAHGLDPDEVIRETGIDPALFQDPENTISFAAVGRLFVRTAAVTGIEYPGLELGRVAGLDVLGNVGQLMSFAPDFGTALRALIRQFHLHDRGAVPILWETGSQSMFGYTLYSQGIPGTDHISDAALAIAINTFKQLVGKEWKPTEVQMFRDPPVDRSVFRQHFGIRLHFGAEHAAIVFPTTDLERPLQGSNPQAYARLDGELKELDILSGGAMLTNRVRRLIRGMIASGAGLHGIDLRGVAKLLALHPRTLTRHLQAENAAFSSILGQVRYEFAQQMLRDTNLPVAYIGLLLGYAESASFNHAFRRWSGMTATAWRSKNHTTP